MEWFKKQSKIIQVLLLLIPFVSWIVEIYVRYTVLSKKSTTTNIIGLVFGAVCFQLAGIIDAIFLLVKDEFILVEE